MLGLTAMEALVGQLARINYVTVVSLGSLDVRLY